MIKEIELGESPNPRLRFWFHQKGMWLPEKQAALWWQKKKKGKKSSCHRAWTELVYRRDPPLPERIERLELLKATANVGTGEGKAGNTHECSQGVCWFPRWILIMKDQNLEEKCIFVLIALQNHLIALYWQSWHSASWQKRIVYRVQLHITK